MPRDSDVVLQEILSAIALARAAVADAGTFERFAMRAINRAATERAIEIISEAVRHLPSDVMARHPALPWNEIKAIGNKLRHEYHGVEPKIIWDVVVHDLDELERVVRSELTGSAQ